MARHITDQQEAALFAGAAGIPELFAGAAGYNVPDLYAGAAGFGGYDFKTHKGIVTPGRRQVLERRCSELGICNQEADKQRMALYNLITYEYCKAVMDANGGIGPSGGKGCGGIYPKAHRDQIEKATDEAWKAGRRVEHGSYGHKQSGGMGKAGLAIGGVLLVGFLIYKFK